MSPLLFMVLSFSTFIFVMACVRHVAAPKNKKYDPHYVRKLEIQELGSAVTQCSNEKCMECYPKVPVPSSGGVSKAVSPGNVIDQLNENISRLQQAAKKNEEKIKKLNSYRPEYRIVDGYRVYVPDGVPANAFAYADFNHMKDIVTVIFKWTDIETGKQMYRRSIPTEQFAPKYDYVRH